MAKRILNWSKSTKIFVKIILMLICCVGLSTASLLLQNSVIREFSFASGADITADVAANFVFFTLLQWFAGFLVLMLIINLIFFIIDEYRNDFVKWRRSLQVILNVCVILTGLIAGYVLLNNYFPNLYWWQYLLLRPSFIKELTWVPYLVFAGCCIFQFFWDVWLFGPENRSPLIAKMLHRSALKQELKKGSRA